MKKICKDCGTEFELSDAEIGFYNSKGLELPKRCKSCRDMNNGRITSGAMGSRTTSNFNSNSHSSRNYSSNNYSSNRHSSNGYGAGGSSGSSYASGNAGGTGGNKKMIGIFIVAIALVVIIGVIATVKSLSRNSNSNYVADNSTQTNVSDLAATNDGINDTAGDSESSLEVGDSDGDKENAEEENADGESADVESGDSDSAVDSDLENTSGNVGNSTTDASSQGNASSSQGGASAEQQSTPTQETTTTPQEPTPVVEETAPVQVTYYFRNSNLLNQHYEKHGIEMGFGSAEEYQAAASAVIINPNALSKIEAEDGDFVYYVEATNEFVVLSTDGYIRTYFLPSGGKAYYDRQ